jgi:hypothetical protein
VVTVVVIAAGAGLSVLNKDVRPSDRTRAMLSGARCAVVVVIARGIAGRRIPRHL